MTITVDRNDLQRRIAELEAEVKKWKLEVCKWQDVNSDLEQENTRLKERMEFMFKNKAGFKGWFTDEGKVK